MKAILFACLHNAGRSQMAAAFFNAAADPQRARAVSAGTAPAARVHPEVVTVMQEVGLDLSAATPQQLTTDLAASAALLVTMGCGDRCPSVPGLETQDWPLADPKGQSLDVVRSIRDDIRRRVEQLVDAQGWSAQGWRRGQDLLDWASDRAFARLQEVGGDPRSLDDPLRTVVVLYSAQGVIDNGGLRYFFDCDWPGEPPYAVFSAAYRLIGATAEADAIDAVAASFGIPDPERDQERRRAGLAGPVGERIEQLDAECRSDVWRLLADYVRAHESGFALPG